MSEATQPNTTTLPLDRIMDALGTMEDRINMIRNVDGILCHVMGSPSVIDGEDLYPLSEVLANSHKALEEARMMAWAAVRELEDAHKAELSRLRAELTGDLTAGG